MTLYRQLALFTALLILLLFCGTWLVLFDGIRLFVSNQLNSHAQDTATSFALSIQPHVDSDDLATVDTMMNAIFDRGYYAELHLEDINGETLLRKTRSKVIENIPDWFVSFAALDLPKAEAIVMKGWTHVGLITVESHPGYAYSQLWRTTRNVSVWFVLISVATMIIGIAGLGMLLRPLHRVEQQARALGRREFKIQKRIPKTRELRRVVEQMNQLTGKLKSIFEAEAANIESLRKRLYLDDLTGLGNRRFFEDQIDAEFTHNPDCHGILLELALDDLNQLNQSIGSRAADELIKEIANIIRHSVSTYERNSISRLTGGQFGIFVPGCLPEDAEYISHDITTRLNQLVGQKPGIGPRIAHVGGVFFDSALPLSQLFDETETGLGHARQGAANDWHVHRLSVLDQTGPDVKESSKEFLEKALARNRITLISQAVIDAKTSTKVLHKEIFARLDGTSEQSITAASFIPMAEQLGIVSELDRQILLEFFEKHARAETEAGIAINISPDSLNDSSFVDWLIEYLGDMPTGPGNICFEFSETGAVRHLEKLLGFAAAVRYLGHGIGIDHFGHGFTNFAYLEKLRPDYVKIDQIHATRLLKGDNDGAFLIKSLCAVAHSLDIHVIVTGIQSELQIELLKDLRIDGFQGFLIAPSVPLSQS